MANELKWTDWRSTAPHRTVPSVETPTARSAWLSVLGCLAGLAILAIALPGPTAWPATLAGAGPAATSGRIGGAAEAALLMTAGVLVWVSLIWGMVLVCVAVLGRLPGTPGRVGRLVLGRIAPAAAGRLLVATVGVSLLAGTTACAGPVLAASTTTGTTSAATISASSTAAPGTDGSAPIDIDWPTGDPAPSVPTPPGTVAAPPATVTPPATAASPAPATPPAAEAPPGTTGALTTPPSSPVPTVMDPPGPPTAADPAPQTAPEVDAPLTPPAPPDPDAGPADQAPTDPGPGPGPGLDPVPGPGPDPDSGPGPTGGPTLEARNGEVRVQPGDTLWSIAAAALPASAAASDIDAAWRAWYLTNRQVVGDDPDLIQPGQLLLSPTADQVVSS